jgi:hypothetical protein
VLPSLLVLCMCACVRACVRFSKTQISVISQLNMNHANKGQQHAKNNKQRIRIGTRINSTTLYREHWQAIMKQL